MEKYEKLQPIGNGQFGVVSKIRRKTDGKILVWKQVNYGSMSKQQKNQLVNQVNILKELNHQNIVKYYQHILDKKCSMVKIVMEYCPGGDLGAVLQDIQKKGQFLDEDLIWKLFFQLTMALHYCHRKKILHRDLKPANIFIDSSRSNIKIGDFGLSRELGEHSLYAKTFVGTPYYMSPQQYFAKKYNQKSDIWSLGCILYQLAALKRPFKGGNLIQLGYKIQSGVIEPLPNRYSCNLKNIISQMLSVNSNLRPTTTDLLNIPQLKIRLQERQIRHRYQQLKKHEQYLKNKDQQYRQKLKNLQSTQLNISESLKKTKSVFESNLHKGGKPLTIQI